MKNTKHYITEYDLPTTRQRKGRIKTALYRKEIRLKKEEKYQAKQEAAPVLQQFGWKQTFVLREDVARSKHAAFFQRLLDKVNTVQYSMDRQFKEQRLSDIDWNTWRELSYAERQQFSWKYKNYRAIFLFTDKWRFVLHVQPNMVLRPQLSVVEKEIRQINKKKITKAQNPLKNKAKSELVMNIG